jgi:hypothetical protein
MAAPVLCILIPVDPGAHPAHPIAPGGSPPGIWGPPGPWPTPPIAPGGPPPEIWPSPGYPAHPIAPGGPPPGIWGGGNVPMPTPPIYYPPSGGQPGYPAHPIVLPPGTPSHPIEIPPPPDGPPSGGDGSWKFSPVYGWVWVPAGSGGKPQPLP